MSVRVQTPRTLTYKLDVNLGNILDHFTHLQNDKYSMVYKGEYHIHWSCSLILKVSSINKCSEAKTDQILDRQKTFTKETYVCSENAWKPIIDIEYSIVPTKTSMLSNPFEGLNCYVARFELLVKIEPVYYTLEKQQMQVRLIILPECRRIFCLLVKKCFITLLILHHIELASLQLLSITLSFALRTTVQEGKQEI